MAGTRKLKKPCKYGRNETTDLCFKKGEEARISKNNQANKGEKVKKVEKVRRTTTQKQKPATLSSKADVSKAQIIIDKLLEQDGVIYNKKTSKQEYIIISKPTREGLLKAINKKTADEEQRKKILEDVLSLCLNSVRDTYGHTGVKTLTPKRINYIILNDDYLRSFFFDKDNGEHAVHDLPNFKNYVVHPHLDYKNLWSRWSAASDNNNIHNNNK